MKLITKRRTIGNVPVLEVVPKDMEFEPLPLVIYYHGWETSKELALTPARKIARYNIRVVLPDAMFHGERRVNERSSVPSMTFWSTIQHNLSEFYLLKHFFNKRELILDNKIGVGGFSMGGMTTSGLLTKHADIKAAAILMGTPSYQGFIDRVVEAASTFKQGIPYDLEELLSWTKNYDLNTQPEILDGRPLYFWHGTEDVKIPYSASRDFYDIHKNKDYGKKMSYDTGEGKPHILTPDIMEKTAQFFNENL